MADEADRSEAATPRRREEARRHGQVVVSREIAPVAVLFAATSMATWGGPRLLERCALVFRSWLAGIGPLAARDASGAPALAHALLEVGEIVVPFLLAMGVVATGAIVAQIGFTAT